jgi:hypothetical protein
MTRGVRKDTGKSANWKGGKTVTSRGYVLVWVGKDHPLADVRGYAYEHRLVAAEKEGRVLESEEHVHHKDEDRQNNAPENLEALSLPAHFLEHRTAGSKLRLPGEANSVAICACGCGKEFLKYDAAGRPRAYVSGHNPRRMYFTEIVLCACGCGTKLLKQDAQGRVRSYVSGHNPQASPLRDAIRGALAQGACDRTELAHRVGVAAKALGPTLSKMKKAGVVSNANGCWRWTEVSDG